MNYLKAKEYLTQEYMKTESEKIKNEITNALKQDANQANNTSEIIKLANRLEKGEANP